MIRKGQEIAQKINIPLFRGYRLLDILGLVARIALGVVFLLASYDKILHNAQFAQNVSNYHMMPIGITPIFAFILPWIELITGVYLILGIFTKITASVAIFLLLMFIGAITYALITNQPVTTCGCFSQNPTDKIGWIDDIRDSLFIILALIILIAPKIILSLDTLLHLRKSPEGDIHA